MGWQSALRSLAPVLAQDAEIFWGEPLSLALQAALEGQGEWTPELEREHATKRPHQRAEMEQARMKSALDDIAASLAAEREARAARTPSPEDLRRQRVNSINSAAAAQAAAVHGGAA